MRVSVIIPAFNAAETLPGLLRALGRQTAPPHEIIVVDDASSDGTAAMAESLGAVVVRRGINGGPGPARNAGVRAAKGEVVMFTDADCVTPDDWIERGLRFMREYSARATTSGYLGPVESGLSAWFQHWEKRSREPFSAKPIFAANGHSLALEKSLYEEAGGMSALRTSEDFLFGLMVSRRAPVHYDPDNGVYHLFRPGLAGYLRQKMLFAQNSVLCGRHGGLGMSSQATFSPWRTLLELGLSAGALATLVLLPWAALVLAVLRAAPFWLFLSRRPVRGTVPAMLYVYSGPQLILRDLASLVGLLRGALLVLFGREVPYE